MNIACNGDNIPKEKVKKFQEIYGRRITNFSSIPNAPNDMYKTILQGENQIKSNFEEKREILAKKSNFR